MINKMVLIMALKETMKSAVYLCTFDKSQSNTFLLVLL